MQLFHRLCLASTTHYCCWTNGGQQGDCFVLLSNLYSSGYGWKISFETRKFLYKRKPEGSTLMVWVRVQMAQGEAEREDVQQCQCTDLWGCSSFQTEICTQTKRHFIPSEKWPVSSTQNYSAVSDICRCTLCCLVASRPWQPFSPLSAVCPHMGTASAVVSLFLGFKAIMFCLIRYENSRDDDCHNKKKLVICGKNGASGPQQTTLLRWESAASPLSPGSKQIGDQAGPPLHSPTPPSPWHAFLPIFFLSSIGDEGKEVPGLSTSLWQCQGLVEVSGQGLLRTLHVCFSIGYTHPRWDTTNDCSFSSAAALTFLFLDLFLN